ncbi:MAG TPA: type IV toxin-antitoxin system AbiEi family antitoxin domain-containing protein [Longimicrobiales bacterium]
MATMTDPTRRRKTEAVITSIASRQHGVVTRGQLLAAGIGPDVIDRRLKAGVLHPLHRGVYRVGPVAAPRAREMAACMACGRSAVVSHGSAAALWGLLPVAAHRAPVDITITRGNRGRLGVRVHRVRRLCSDEVTKLDSIPITTPARTLLDLSGTIEPRELEQALAEAFAQRLARPAAIRRVLARHAARAGRAHAGRAASGRRAGAHAFGGRGATAAPDPEGGAGPAGGQRAGGRPSRRFLLARTEVGRGSRRLRVPRFAASVRTRPPPRRGVDRRWNAGDARDLAADRRRAGDGARTNRASARRGGSHASRAGWMTAGQPLIWPPMPSAISHSMSAASSTARAPGTGVARIDRTDAVRVRVVDEVRVDQGRPGTVDLGGESGEVGGEASDVGSVGGDVGCEAIDVGGDAGGVGGDAVEVDGDASEVGGEASEVGGEASDVGGDRVAADHRGACRGACRTTDRATRRAAGRA